VMVPKWPELNFYNMEKTSVKKHLAREHITVNAEGKSVGRLASKIAVLLQGKYKPSYNHAKDEGDFVKVVNADKMQFTGTKYEQKKYYSYSGFPGGLKEKKLSTLYPKNPEKVIELAVFNMLPKNRLRNSQLKRLTFIKK